MNVIKLEVELALARAGIANVRIETVLAPAWTTDWISEEGKRKLREYGIAPPGPTLPDGGVPIRIFRRTEEKIACPHCGSLHTEKLSAFGSTACKALYRCLSCTEPFEFFKPI